MDVWMEMIAEMIDAQAVIETFIEILIYAVLIWLTVMLGLLIGWIWKPRWTGLVFLGLRSKLRLAWTSSPGFGALRLWLAFTALSAFSVGYRLLFNSRRMNHIKDSPRAATPVTQADVVSQAGLTHSFGTDRGGDDIRFVGFGKSKLIFLEILAAEKIGFVHHLKKKHHYQEIAKASGFSPNFLSQ